MTAQRLTLSPFRCSYFEKNRSCKSVFKMSRTLLAVRDCATFCSNDISLSLKHIPFLQAHSSLPEVPHNLHSSFWSRHTVFRAPKSTHKQHTTLYTYCMKGCTVRRFGFTRWFKYDRDWFVCKQAAQVPVIFEPPCIFPHSAVMFLLYPIQTRHTHTCM
jgi:hypothetical protein